MSDYNNPENTILKPLDNNNVSIDVSSNPNNDYDSFQEYLKRQEKNKKYFANLKKRTEDFRNICRPYINKENKEYFANSNKRTEDFRNICRPYINKNTSPYLMKKAKEEAKEKEKELISAVGTIKDRNEFQKFLSLEHRAQTTDNDPKTKKKPEAGEKIRLDSFNTTDNNSTKIPPISIVKKTSYYLSIKPHNENDENEKQIPKSNTNDLPKDNTRFGFKGETYKKREITITKTTPKLTFPTN